MRRCYQSNALRLVLLDTCEDISSSVLAPNNKDTSRHHANSSGRSMVPSQCQSSRVEHTPNSRPAGVCLEALNWIWIGDRWSAFRSGITRHHVHQLQWLGGIDSTSYRNTELSYRRWQTGNWTPCVCCWIKFLDRRHWKV